jgi:hypothetical protein
MYGVHIDSIVVAVTGDADRMKKLADSYANDVDGLVAENKELRAANLRLQVRISRISIWCTLRMPK